MSYNFQKWYYFILFFLFLACAKDTDWNIYEPISHNKELQIDGAEGLKVSGNFITNRSNFNIKVSTAGKYTLEVLNIAGIAVTRDNLNLKVGDNILTFYTNAIEDGDYTINVKNDSGIVQTTKMIIQ